MLTAGWTSTPCQSGSGVYSIEENEERYAFAIHAWGNNSTNGGMQIDSSKLDSIEAWIEEDR
jgi:hypothetical protein